MKVESRRRESCRLDPPAGSSRNLQALEQFDAMRGGVTGVIDEQIGLIDATLAEILDGKLHAEESADQVRSRLDRVKDEIGDTVMHVRQLMESL